MSHCDIAIDEYQNVTLTLMSVVVQRSSKFMSTFDIHQWLWYIVAYIKVYVKWSN